MGIVVASLSAMMAERAAQLRADHRHLRLPDAMVLACVQEVGGERLSYAERLARHARSADGP
ncbi:MAG TPA: hypothetical protein VGO80_08780 [Solirubrobacteraceae bacterium]|jgi:hypothetical protein|nr:hypothetical protein [Solirubrobacteraceae bacterium]